MSERIQDLSISNHIPPRQTYDLQQYTRHRKRQIIKRELKETSSISLGSIAKSVTFSKNRTRSFRKPDRNKYEFQSETVNYENATNQTDLDLQNPEKTNKEREDWRRRDLEAEEMQGEGERGTKP